MACDYTCHHFHWKLDEIHQLLTFVQNWIDWALHLLLEIDWRPNVHTNNRLGTRTTILPKLFANRFFAGKN